MSTRRDVKQLCKAFVGAMECDLLRHMEMHEEERKKTTQFRFMGRVSQSDLYALTGFGVTRFCFDTGYVRNAEMYATMAEREGALANLRQYVPATPPSAAMQAEFARRAPTFTKLCL
ncbi:hypothetical protein [Arvimicrobium flavum]|uniref:hypothetical protein n=1 Tax=Arvimicrobium flavum TaxID=3393320 RepID=UPI00237ACB4B|nr:hypothetical protein [Mesorhizobium shangrilense]